MYSWPASWEKGEIPKAPEAQRGRTKRELFHKFSLLGPEERFTERNVPGGERHSLPVTYTNMYQKVQSYVRDLDSLEGNRLVLVRAKENQRHKVVIGDRLRSLREQKNLSQGDMEKRTGLLRCYISRVENAHTVPTIETLEKLARALEIPLYQLFYDGNEPPKVPHLPKRISRAETAWGHSGKDSRTLGRFRNLLSRIDGNDRDLLLSAAQKMASQTKARKKTK
jgi:transcriptional regulator with XRE-family HTH domain